MYVFLKGSEAHVRDMSPSPAPAGSETFTHTTTSTSQKFSPGYKDNAPIVVVLNDDDEPLVSTSVREATRDAAVQYLEEDNARVTFLLGM